ncbi:MAG TPA: histidine kinase [Steroidobacteraceae bacterium]|jgi:hypothetical protein
MIMSTHAAAAHRSPPFYALCQLGGWGLYAFANVIVGAGLEQAPLGITCLQFGLLGILGIGMSHLLRAYMRAHGWLRLDLRARIPRVLGATLVLSVAAAFVSWFFELADWQSVSVPIDAVTQLPVVALAIHCFNWMALLLAWCIIYFSVQSVRQRRSSELRESQTARALQTSELRSLKAQLNPHFLFNALNTVRALISIDAPRAQQAITQLARTLRYTLSASEDEFMPLEQELAIVDDYLALESLRLGERLSVDRRISPESRSVRIPVMLLQTLVENAIKHGIAELQGGGVLQIQSGLNAGVLTITVQNPRPETVANSGEGIGLRNAHERLRLLYGTGASLHLDMSHARMALVRLTLPASA